MATFFASKLPFSLIISKIHPKYTFMRRARLLIALSQHYKMQALKKFIAGKSIPHFPNMQLTSQ